MPPRKFGAAAGRDPSPPDDQAAFHCVPPMARPKRNMSGGPASRSKLSLMRPSDRTITGD